MSTVEEKSDSWLDRALQWSVRSLFTYTKYVAWLVAGLTIVLALLADVPGQGKLMWLFIFSFMTALLHAYLVGWRSGVAMERQEPLPDVNVLHGVMTMVFAAAAFVCVALLTYATQ